MTEKGRGKKKKKRKNNNNNNQKTPHNGFLRRACAAGLVLPSAGRPPGALVQSHADPTPRGRAHEIFNSPSSRNDDNDENLMDPRPRTIVELHSIKVNRELLMFSRPGGAAAGR